MGFSGYIEEKIDLDKLFLILILCLKLCCKNYFKNICKVGNDDICF